MKRIFELTPDESELVRRALNSYAVTQSREANSRKWAGKPFADRRRELRTEAHNAYQLARGIPR